MDTLHSVDRRRLFSIPTFAATALPWLVLHPSPRTVLGVFAGPLLWLGQARPQWTALVLGLATLGVIVGSAVRPHVAWVFAMVPVFELWSLSGIAFVHGH